MCPFNSPIAVMYSQARTLAVELVGELGRGTGSLKNVRRKASPSLGLRFIVFQCSGTTSLESLLFGAVHNEAMRKVLGGHPKPASRGQLKTGQLQAANQDMFVLP
jgi:hypothetical protein